MDKLVIERTEEEQAAEDYALWEQRQGFCVSKEDINNLGWNSAENLYGDGVANLQNVAVVMEQLNRIGCVLIDIRDLLARNLNSNDRKEYNDDGAGKFDLGCDD